MADYDPKKITHVGDAVIYRVSGHERVPHPKDPRAAPVAAFPVAQLGALLPARIVEDWGGQCVANAHPNLDVFPSGEIDVGEAVRVNEAWYGEGPGRWALPG